MTNETDTRELKAEVKISRCTAYLMIEDPFFSAVLMGMEVGETQIPEVSTMATDGRQIIWNREFVDSMTLHEVLGVLLHEVTHVTMLHPLRRGSRDPKIWNYACDLAINQMIIEWGYTLPEPHLNMKKYHGMTAERIYDDLMQGVEDNGGSPEGSGISDEQGEQSAMGDVIDPKNANGTKLTEDELQQLGNEISQSVSNAMTQAKKVGRVPGGLEGVIKKINPPQVDWQDRIRRFAGGDQPNDYTYQRLNKKMFHSYRSVAPSVTKIGCGHLVFGIDTSGSVLNKELSQYLGEINAMSEELGAEKVTIIYCDSRVQKVDEYGPGEEIDTLGIKGRGGTCVTPVFNYIEEENIRPDTFIYFSDMEVWDFPEEAPNYPVMWVNSSGHGGETPPFGEVCRVFV